jgi:hypothetical protein
MYERVSFTPRLLYPCELSPAGPVGTLRNKNIFYARQELNHRRIFFSIYLILPVALGPRVHSALNRNIKLKLGSSGNLLEVTAPISQSTLFVINQLRGWVSALLLNSAGAKDHNVIKGTPGTTRVCKCDSSYRPCRRTRVQLNVWACVYCTTWIGGSTTDEAVGAHSLPQPPLRNTRISESRIPTHILQSTLYTIRGPTK